MPAKIMEHLTNALANCKVLVSVDSDQQRVERAIHDAMCESMPIQSYVRCTATPAESPEPTQSTENILTCHTSENIVNYISSTIMSYFSYKPNQIFSLPFPSFF